MSGINQVQGKAVALRGENIDTDRIIPARFLKLLTFNELGEHVFEDDRREAAKRGAIHPFDDPAHSEASILIVNDNFGCGSSREHAAQALRRWGIRAIVGERFGEIFFGNCISVGVPCLSVTGEVLAELQDYAESAQEGPMTVDIQSRTISWGNHAAEASIPEGPRNQFIDGSWDATALLLSNLQAVRSVGARIAKLDGIASRA